MGPIGRCRSTSARPRPRPSPTPNKGVVTPRPMTHDLMRDLLAELGATVECVVITELRDRTFFAEIRLMLAGQRHTVSARPSDAVALAVRVQPTDLRRGRPPRRRGRRPARARDGEDAAEADELVSQFREFIDGIRPEDFES